jgi:hypothetical protein
MATAPATSLFGVFETHVLALESRKRKRKEDLALKSALETADVPQTIDASVAEAGVDSPQFGQALPEDEFLGDTRLRTLNELLTTIDRSGMERSSQQVQFHAAFKVACMRILYREDWAISRPDIVKKHNIGRVFGEVVRCVSGDCSLPGWGRVFTLFVVVVVAARR